MSSETCVGFMAVVAVSSSVVFLAHQLHRRLATDYMKKIELIYGNNSPSSIMMTIVQSLKIECFISFYFVETVKLSKELEPMPFWTFGKSKKRFFNCFRTLSC